MRIWSLDPAYLDRQALIACWRETLLAQAVLHGNTKGYTNHPQLHRFKEAEDPKQAIVDYLHILADEADARGYKFNRTRLLGERLANPVIMTVTDGQLRYELAHLINKLTARSPQVLDKLRLEEPTLELDTYLPRTHRLFTMIPGDVEHWERV